MSALTYGSVCSGIESASVAWRPLGWKTQFLSEIEAAPRAILSHHYGQVPLHGDFTTIREGEYGSIDLLVGGTPCQSFSVAGLRGGLADDRGNLALQYLRLAQRLGPRWLVWENVPGVLSSNGGRDFGAILGGMGELGYGVAYRVLDAQYVRVDGFGRAVPQRRRRVFVVGYLGDWRRAAAVLFERACLRGDPAPRREAGARIAERVGLSAAISSGQGWWDSSDVGATIRAQDSVTKADTLVAHSLQGEGFDASEDGTGRGTPIVPVASTLLRGGHSRNPMEETLIAFQQGGSNVGPVGPVFNTLTKGNGNETGGVPCIAFSCKDNGRDVTETGASPTLRAMGGLLPNGGGQIAVAYGIRSDASREGSAKTPSADAEGRVRLRDPGLGIYAGLAPTLDAGQPHSVAMTFDWQKGNDVNNVRPSTMNVAIEHAQTLGSTRVPALAHGWAVRRLTPIECERLQGFPDGYTAVPWRGGILSDGPRYKALGNSMAVNAMRWIGRRIEAVDAHEVFADPLPMAAE